MSAQFAPDGDGDGLKGVLMEDSIVDPEAPFVALCPVCHRVLGTFYVTPSQPKETQARRADHLLKTHICKEIPS
jgi:hypothetical protein